MIEAFQPDYHRLLTTLTRSGIADEVPLVELGIAQSIKEAVLGHPINEPIDEILFAQMAGYDFIKLQPIIDMNPSNISPPGGFKDTPLDGAAGTRRWADESTGVISTMADFERYVFPAIESIGYSRFEAFKKILPDSMTVIGQYGDIFTMVWEMMGFEQFSISLYEQPDLIHALFDRIGSLVVSMFETMATFDQVRVLWYSDDIAYAGGLMVSPAVLREYFFPWLQKIGVIAKEYQKPLIYHSDGNLLPVMDDIINCNVDALHPIEPKAMDIREIKNKFGNRLTLIGNIDLSYTLTRGTPDEVEREVKQRISELAPGGGYCLGSANSIPEYVKPENFIRMVQSCKKYGRYPIQ